MAFDIKEIPKVKLWLEQFDLVDKYAAELLLQSLRYISFDEFDKSIQDLVEETVIKVQKKDKACVAVFPVSKVLQNKYNKDKSTKPENDSSGRIAHSLKNLERKLGNKIEVTPRVESMLEKKIRHIIYVDDIIGSGKRFIDFWRNDVSRTIKSWVSGGHCNIWLISHTVHASGLKRITSKVRAIDAKRVSSKLRINSSSLLTNDVLKSLIEKYGQRTHKSGAKFGFGSNCSPVIFQHGCPNNAPALLWANGKPNGKVTLTPKVRWDALFSNRSIDTSLYPLFEDDFSPQSYPELLWSARQYRLALEFCESEHEDAKLYNLILALASQGYSKDKISEILIPIQSESNLAIETLVENELIDENMKLSVFGRDVLERNRQKKKNEFVDKKYADYYPSAFLGFHREI